MKNTITLDLLILVLVFFSSCEKEENLSAFSGKAKLHSEEFLIYDPASPVSVDGFVGSHKLIYTHDQNKLTQIDIYDYNPHTKSFDYPGYKMEEYNYDSKGKLIRKIYFVGGIKWIHEYEYLNNESIKVTRYEYYKDAPISQPDWWIMEKRPFSLIVKYYQGNNDLYAELNYEMDGRGNVISVMRNSSFFPAGKIYYKYDNSPNPFKFPELGGIIYGFDTEKYLSQNNVIESTDDSNGKSTRTIEYNTEGYPVIIIASTYKRVLTYQ